MNRRIQEWFKGLSWYRKYKLADHLLITYAVLVTVAGVWLYIDKVEGDPAIKDWLIVSNACSDKVIEARAESVFYGKVSKLVFYCK